MNLQEFISNAEEPILLDGAMGTILSGAGFETGGRANLSHPQAVSAIHRSYIGSGAEIIITNTLTINRAFVFAHNVELDVREANLAGAQLARAAAGDSLYVVGDISSIANLLKPDGNYTKEEAGEVFQEQATVLAEGGVDGFIIETMVDLRAALCALRACKEAADLPVIVSMVFNTLENGGQTRKGDTARDCALSLTEAGADVIGANCGSLNPSEMADIVSAMQAVSSLPVIAQPNAGHPKMVEGRSVFDVTPADFSAGIEECIQAGAKLVGGCCGTNPAHIQGVADLLGR